MVFIREGSRHGDVAMESEVRVIGSLAPLVLEAARKQGLP